MSNLATLPRRVALLISLLLTALVYWTGLHGPLLFDDRDNLLPVAAWLEGRVDAASVIFGNTSGYFGRPLSILSFMLNAALLGPGVWGLKIGNLLIHLINGVLVFNLLQILATRYNITTSCKTNKNWIAWLGASIWLLHPLLVSTVLYVVQRMAMLSALFTLLALIAYTHGRHALCEGRNRKAWTLIGLMVPLCTAFAMLSKENGILAPALCGVIELFAFQSTTGLRRAWPSRIFIGMTLLLPTLIALVLIIVGSPLILTGYENRPFSLNERLMTESRVLWDYVGALLLPNGPTMGIYHDDYVISRGWLSPSTTVIALIAWMGLLATVWRLRRSAPLFGLGITFFLVGHALESTVFPLLPYFEHRNYLPSVGLIWAAINLAIFTVRTHLRVRSASSILAAFSIFLIIALALSTAARTRVWASQLSILEQALVYHPDSRWLRQDLFARAMEQVPPDTESARAHADHLLSSSSASTRRLGALERILLDCNAGKSPDVELIRIAYTPPPEPIEADVVATFELLGSHLRANACSGFKTSEAATQLAVLLDHSKLPPRNTALRALRLEAARLYTAASDPAAAIEQTRLIAPNDSVTNANALHVVGEISGQSNRTTTSSHVIPDRH